MIRNTIGPLAATSPRRPFNLKAAVAASAGIGLLSMASAWAQDAVVADASGEPAAEVSVVTVSGVRRADSIAGLADAPSREIKDKLFQRRMYAIRRNSAASGPRSPPTCSTRFRGARRPSPCLLPATSTATMAPATTAAPRPATTYCWCTMPAPTRKSSATRCGIRLATRLSNRGAGMRKACPCLAAHRPCKTWTLRHDPS